MIEHENGRGKSSLNWMKSEGFERFMGYAVYYMIAGVTTRGLHYLLNARWFAERFREEDPINHPDVQKDEDIMKVLGIGGIAIPLLLASPFLKRDLENRLTRRQFLGRTALAVAGLAGMMIGNLRDGEKYKDQKQGAQKEIEISTMIARHVNKVV